VSVIDFNTDTHNFFNGMWCNAADVDGCIDGSIDGFIDGFIDGCIDR